MSTSRSIGEPPLRGASRQSCWRNGSFQTEEPTNRTSTELGTKQHVKQANTGHHRSSSTLYHYSQPCTLQRVRQSHHIERKEPSCPRKPVDQENERKKQGTRPDRGTPPGPGPSRQHTKWSLKRWKSATSTSASL